MPRKKKIRLDFSEVTERNFDPIPVGAYEVKVTDAEVRDSKSSDYQYISWEFTIQNHAEFANRKLWAITSFSPKAMWKFKETLIAFGETEKSLETTFDFDMDKYFGREATALVDLETYTDNTGAEQQRNVISALQPLVREGVARIK